ncbi:tRNA (adenosine(37)-N6)-threonylcarbamoyltransferase complex dimerization subunit type 1 TsaB [uncultured Pseudacidovorax sp.]|uniref:tRNA (adenosine(37)-N6)-threonylcarbamoyltransferase complex dimerization subunit type 1 TsaB n=1 Tax=uncultured Pseudacidovorax sp. TaxID=679313 RepID=UPI0025FCC263|nr:tRNA (adenosine(37)-N6)-threonylcarbamoyltransferase complex dimerization subunit type 1 TsaB [uncultured Pseudacidovorax sp.]
MPELLAFDCSTDTLSVAVQHGDRVVARTQAGGAQASAALIPLIHELLAEAGLTLGQLQAIVFGRGPGAFTGLRTACAVAQGLGYGANLPVLPVDTLRAVAEEARHATGARQVLAVLDARMDEVYAAACDTTAGTCAAPRLMAPQQVEVPAGHLLAGNAFAAYGERLPAGAPRHACLPTATALLRLAPALLAAGAAVPAAEAQPLYVRDKVAQTTAERQAAKAEAAGAGAAGPALPAAGPAPLTREGRP